MSMNKFELIIFQPGWYRTFPYYGTCRRTKKSGDYVRVFKDGDIVLFKERLFKDVEVYSERVFEGLLHDQLGWLSCWDESELDQDTLDWYLNPSTFIEGFCVKSLTENNKQDLDELVARFNTFTIGDEFLVIRNSLGA
jgi:hypothetical protein